MLLPEPTHQKSWGVLGTCHRFKTSLPDSLLEWGRWGRGKRLSAAELRGGRRGPPCPGGAPRATESSRGPASTEGWPRAEPEPEPREAGGKERLFLRPRSFSPASPALRGREAPRSERGRHRLLWGDGMGPFWEVPWAHRPTGNPVSLRKRPSRPTGPLLSLGSSTRQRGCLLCLSRCEQAGRSQETQEISAGSRPHQPRQRKHGVPL